MAPPTTKRLDIRHPRLFDFNARVLGHAEWKGQPSVLLDQTAFYPESGGQMADHGLLGEGSVVDVQLDTAGVVHHIVEGQMPQKGEKVSCSIDRSRRRQHMAQHTGQHLLSWALTELAQAPTVSSRLGETACTLDVKRQDITEEELQRVSDAVNRAIADDAEVRFLYPTPDELKQMSLRRHPKVTRGIRIVAIGDFELVPCGGTHCARTAEVRLLTILGAEHYKGMTRVTFAAGEGARQLLEQRSTILKKIGLELSCSPTEVPLALRRLQRKLESCQEKVQTLRELFAKERAHHLLSRTKSSFVVDTIEKSDADMLRAVGRHLIEGSGRVALLAAPNSEGVSIFVARSEDLDNESATQIDLVKEFNCGAFVRKAAETSGGRGGGRTHHAEGRLPAGVDWVELVERLDIK